MSHSEYHVKQEMADRLTTLIRLDPIALTSFMRTQFIVNPSVAQSQVVCTLCNDKVITTFLGIMNGMVGQNEYIIYPVYKDSRLVGFNVKRHNEIVDDLLEAPHLIRGIENNEN